MPLFVLIPLWISGYLYIRVILSHRSQIFRMMFSNGMKESTQREIILEEERYQPFLEFLQYLYTDHIDLHPDRGN